MTPWQGGNNRWNNQSNGNQHYSNWNNNSNGFTAMQNAIDAITVRLDNCNANVDSKGNPTNVLKADGAVKPAAD